MVRYHFRDRLFDLCSCTKYELADCGPNGWRDGSSWPLYVVRFVQLCSLPNNGDKTVVFMIQTVAQVIRLEDRPKLFGTLGAVFGLSSFIGPLIGDTFRDRVSSFHYLFICFCTAYRLFSHSLITSHLGMFLSVFLHQIPFLAHGYSNSAGVSLTISDQQRLYHSHYPLAQVISTLWGRSFSYRRNLTPSYF